VLVLYRARKTQCIEGCRQKGCEERVLAMKLGFVSLHKANKDDPQGPRDVWRQ
jgi:hypothetical protein